MDIHLNAMKINQLRLKDKNLYLTIEYEQFNDETELLDTIANELENNIQIIQLNCGHAKTKNIIETGKKIRELCSIYNALFIINDRLDIALEIEADGVFIDKNSFNVKSARELLSDKHIIGTDYSEENIDFIISDEKVNNSDIPCYKRISENKKNNKKIIYKKF